MEYLWSAITNWYIVALSLIAILLLFIILKLAQTLRKPTKKDSTQSPLDSANLEIQSSRFLGMPNVYLLALACLFLAIVIVTIVWSLKSVIDNNSDPIDNTESAPTEFIIKVQIGGTGVAFDNDIRISLIQTRYEGSPPRYRVYAVILSPGSENLMIEHGDIGYNITYKVYNIQILNADAKTAQFIVKKVKS